MSQLPKEIELRVDITRERLIEQLVFDVVAGFVNPQEVLPEIERTSPKLAQRVRDILYQKSVKQ